MFIRLTFLLNYHTDFWSHKVKIEEPRHLSNLLFLYPSWSQIVLHQVASTYTFIPSFPWLSSALWTTGVFISDDFDQPIMHHSTYMLVPLFLCLTDMLCSLIFLLLPLSFITYFPWDSMEHFFISVVSKSRFVFYILFYIFIVFYFI